MHKAHPLSHKGEGKYTFVESWHCQAIPVKDESLELCIYCCTDPQTKAAQPYCSALCAAMAQAG